MSHVGPWSRTQRVLQSAVIGTILIMPLAATCFLWNATSAVGLIVNGQFPTYTSTDDANDEEKNHEAADSAGNDGNKGVERYRHMGCFRS